MKARVSIKTIGGQTTDHARGSVSFACEDDQDAEAIARAITEAIRGIGINRMMLVAALVAKKLGDYAAPYEIETDVDKRFHAAAGELVEYWEESDRKLNESIRDDRG